MEQNKEKILFLIRSKKILRELRLSGTVLMFTCLVGCGWMRSLTTYKAQPVSTSCKLNEVNINECQLAESSAAVTDKIGNDITNYTNLNSSNTVSALIPTGWYKGKSCQFSDSNLVSENILSGSAVFGVGGVSMGRFSANVSSMAHRGPGSVPVANHADNQNVSKVVTLYAEKNMYSGLNLPNVDGYLYRDIPDQIKDDDGYLGTSCRYAPRPTILCGTDQATVADRISDCENLNGICSNLISSTKVICESAGGVWSSFAFWDGETQCNGGQGQWKLVTLAAVNKEVWRDQRTGLLWSSLVSTASDWCQASGNTQEAPVTYRKSYHSSLGIPIAGNGKISGVSGGPASMFETITVEFTSATSLIVTGTVTNCDQSKGSFVGVLSSAAGSATTFTSPGVCSFTLTQGTTPFSSGDTFILDSSTISCSPGSGLQPNNPISLCAESDGLNPSGETWTTTGYMSAKGHLGKNSVPKVRWRLPTLKDYHLAEINGLKFIMPDHGIVGLQRPVRDSSAPPGTYAWTSTIDAVNRSNSWSASSREGGQQTSITRNSSLAVRCIGRSSE